MTRRPGTWEQVAMLVLPYVTAILGTVVVMLAVGHQARGRGIGLVRASLRALPWVPRYFWTNVHTSAIFWAPVGLLLLVRAWQEVAVPSRGPQIAATPLLRGRDRSCAPGGPHPDPAGPLLRDPWQSAWDACGGGGLARERPQLPALPLHPDRRRGAGGGAALGRWPGVDVTLSVRR